MKKSSSSSFRIQNKPTLKGHKSFSNRSTSNQLPPYSVQAFSAKEKAFEKYKKIYPLEKENIYPSCKKPYLGYYLIKGYKNNMKEDSTLIQDSQNTILRMLKKYLARKSMITLRQEEWGGRLVTQ